MAKLVNQMLLLFITLITLSAFTMAQSDTSLTLLTPNGGEYWTVGSFPRITWQSSNILVIKIDISFDGGSTWQSISPAAVATSGSYSNWKITENAQSDQCLIKIAKYDDPNIYDISDSYFRIVTDTSSQTLVVLGSSTAAGTGPSKPDSAWVNRYRNYLFAYNTTIKVVNLAVGGYTTYDIMPTNFIPPPNRPTPKTGNNITKAVTYNPKAIIINLPSNDANMGFSVNEQLSNYDSILAVANDYNIPVWVSTTQPRNFSAAQVQVQFQVRDSTFARFGEKAIDFWTVIADSNGWINSAYNSGDGIHLNDKAHAILFNRVFDKHIINPIVSGIEHQTFVFEEYDLIQNYPNPFNSSTTINYSLPEDGNIQINIYDILGQKVATLVEGYLTRGKHSVKWESKNVSSGIFIYNIVFNGKMLSKKMILTK